MWTDRLLKSRLLASGEGYQTSSCFSLIEGIPQESLALQNHLRYQRVVLILDA